MATCRALQAPGLEFVAFSDVTAADYHPNRMPRFDLVYHLVSPHRRARVRLKVRINAQEAIETPSVLYPGAGWPGASSTTCSALSSTATRTCGAS